MRTSNLMESESDTERKSGVFMRSMKELMQEMGFNKEAPLDAQKAFIKHLIAAANQTSPKVEPIQTQVPKKDEKPVTQWEQLEFVFSEDKRVS